MAVPKKRTGRRAQATRRANWKATKPETTVCSNCGQPVLTHTVCTACGYYKGQPVSLKDRVEVASVEEVKETKKTTKKSTTKKSTKAAAKVEEKAVEAEEVKAEVEETTEEVVEEKSTEE